MTIQTDLDTRLETIRKDHWRRYESDQEHAERFESACENASWFFEAATVGQKAAYDRAIADLRGCWAPRYDRAREAAKGVWYASTADAQILLLDTIEEILIDGEVSEAMADRWAALPAFVKQVEAA